MNVSSLNLTIILPHPQTCKHGNLFWKLLCSSKFKHVINLQCINISLMCQEQVINNSLLLLKYGGKCI
jgi:hypothetical protein